MRISKKTVAAGGLAVLLTAVALIGMIGCGGMTIGDKARVESYLEGKYEGDFEVIVPAGTSRVLQDGLVMSFPVYAYNTADPRVTFKVTEKEDGEGYDDLYCVALMDRQVKEIGDAALRETGLNAVCWAYCFFSDEELAKVQSGAETDLLRYLSKETTPVLSISLYVAIADGNPTLQELEAKLSNAFALVDKRMFGKENVGYGFVLVETDNFDAFRKEVDQYGIDSHPEFETATVLNYLFAQDGGSFTHQGYYRPLSESLAILLGEAPPWYEREK
jgi:hypothetical protein